ncbi:uncharacterized protein LOC118421218 [Branchiostoma floridae]|uniref:Uncharacterized protein LOC118421218 n=1 Tax=Branchiostoma floridae TaxID=7739 RepID=A0A9J7MY19_BRAFL|nr:uncharacterized protein LOC118421218 [Branchiostoma floridae]
MAEEVPTDLLQDTYQQAQDLIPRKVKRACDIRYEVLIKLGNMLDRRDPDGNDWRVMASKLDIPNSRIDNIACKETEKTVAVLRNTTHVSTRQLVKALYEMGQRDALQLLVDFYSSTNGEDPEEQVRAHPGRTQSMDGPTESDERYPVQVRPDRAMSEPVPDSGYSGDSCRLPRQESDQGRQGATGGPSLMSSFSSTSSMSFPQFSQGSTEDRIEEDFFCEESKQFWYTVKGNSAEFKIYFHFVTAMKNSFPNDPLATQLKNNKALKLIKHVFGIKGDKRDKVQVDKFVLLLGWFGPFKADAHGHCVCLAQIQSLIDGSTTRVGNRLDSWFAGYMSQDEANRRLKGQKKSTFLVRFSESLREEGGFSVGLSLGEDQEPVHFNIKGNPVVAASMEPFNAHLEFVPDHEPAKTYPDLVTLVNKRLTSGNPVYEDVFCVRPCQDLPLNVTFTGYEENAR